MDQGFQGIKKGVPPQMPKLVSDQTNSKEGRLLCLLYDKRAFLGPYVATYSYSNFNTKQQPKNYDKSQKLARNDSFAIKRV